MTARPGSRSSVRTLSRRRFVAGASATGFAVAHGRRLAQAQSSAISITRGPTGQPVVALTFDSGGDRGYAGSILDTLANAGIRASFGITGQWAESNGSLVQRIAAEGHVLINHSYSHPSFTGLSSAARKTEVESTERVLTSLTGRGGRPYFRPPYGNYDSSVLADLGAAGFTHNVLWSLDALGWKGLTQDQIVNRVLGNHGNGYIYLMHVFSQSQEGPALPRIISGLRSLGYGFATIPQMLAGSAPPPSPPPPAPAGFTAGERVQVTAGLYLRSAPNLGGRVSTTMPTGTVCTVVSGPNPADGYTWYQLDTPYGRGWAAGEFLRRTSLAPSPSPSPSPPPSPPPVAGGFRAGDRVRVTAGLYLRTAANRSSGVLTTMPTGTVCTIVSGPSPADGLTWYQVDSPYGRGWAAGEYLQRTTAAPSPPPPASGAFKAGDTVRVTAGLYLRTAPNRSSGVLTTMPRGTTCTVVSGPSPADSLTWYQVDTPYGRGWAAGEYLARV
jgi:peptidoglycan/xylan/chitin deacetylase (PgdA/CDA1 family)